MTKFCTSCGAQLADGDLICKNCGAAVAAEPAIPTMEPPVYEAAAPTPMTVPYTPAPTATLNGESQNKPLSMWAYLGLIALFSLPCVGIIAAIVMCFAPKNQHIKNFARGFVIYSVIITVLFGLIGALIGAVIAEAVALALQDYANENGAFTADGDDFNVDDFFDSFENGFEEGFREGFDGEFSFAA